MSEWLPVPGWDTEYEISRNAEIRRCRDGRHVGQYLRNGYLRVRLSRPRSEERVHRLVALAFIPNPEGKPFVNHIDPDTLNNTDTNLEWCTQSENLAHMDRLGRRAKPWQGKRSPNASLTDDEVRCLRDMRAAGASLSEVGRAFGVSKRAAHRCVTMETYRDV